MFLVDSHCHLDQLDLTPHDGDLARALTFAKNEGVGHFLCVGINLKDYPHMLSIVKAHPHVSASVGLHPNETDIAKEPTLEELVLLAADEKVVAIGETGLDYFRSEGDLEWQRARFRTHIHAALQIKKPLIIHSRQAKDDTLRILQEESAASIGGVMHCFTEDVDMAMKAIDLGFYISFSGIVTFQNAKEIQKVASVIPLNRMLIETDSPYLAPVPNRGKSNEPAFVKYVAEYIAKLRNVDILELAETTTNNFFTCFKEAKR